MLSNRREESTTGLKRIRIVASLIAAAMFGMTAVGQFQGNPGIVIAAGVLLSALIGFAIVFVVLTAVILVLKLFRRRKDS